MWKASMTKRGSYGVLLLVLMLSGCLTDPTENPTSDSLSEDEAALTPAQWRALTQSARNQAIVDRTFQDLGKNVGIECKPWAQRVVSQASTNVATLGLTVTSPTNQTLNPWGWGLEQPHAYTVGVSTGIQNVQPGWIVQMRVPLSGGGITPHTAIVLGRSSTEISWIESNWRHDTTVRIRTQTFDEFLAQVQRDGEYQYSVYYIGGG